ncbi:hypothetical protein PG997_002443 [Apiospora hydei]|uniref:DUF5672 domain-containing protein n=1 Tax=Apiospora hydei TaxID=1337664 RepID=A0ABR1X9F4_9PEZI
MSMGELWDKSKTAAYSVWSCTTRRMRIAGALFTFFIVAFWFSIPTIKTVEVPKISLNYAEPVRSPYNESKVALLIENRENPILAPLMLHFMSVVPPDWRFRFMGSNESVQYINRSMAIREQVNAGKLDLTYIPSNMSTAGQEMISRFLTNRWLYETVLQPAEWLLVFQTDSILCANSRQNINDYLEYDWVGAPWNPNGKFGGNGGLSLRRVSSIIEILRDQVRVDGSQPEDRRDEHGQQGEKINKAAAAKPNGTLEAIEHGEYVSGLDDWREGYYEPMGYHTGGTGVMLHSGIWGTPALRRHIWDYCPEVKMTLFMDAAKYVPGNCKANWKRDSLELGGTEDISGYVGINDVGYGTELIDGVEYPMLPPMIPW